MSNADLFIDKYKIFENMIRATYDLKDTDSIVHYLCDERKDFARFEDDIRYCQQVRNLLQHRRKINGHYPVEPSQDMLDLLDRLTEQIAGRSRCRDIAIPFSHLFYRGPDDDLWETIEVLQENTFAIVPVLENRRLVGIFNAYSLFTYMTEHPQALERRGEVRFRDMMPYLDYRNRKHEEILFIRGEQFVDELKVEFEEYFQRKKMLIAAFITDGAREDGEVKGLVTAWDLLGRTARELGQPPMQ